jgi:hypothetical protein
MATHIVKATVNRSGGYNVAQHYTDGVAGQSYIMGHMFLNKTIAAYRKTYGINFHCEFEYFPWVPFSERARFV